MGEVDLKKIRWIIPVFIVIIFFLHISGYRLTSKGAAEAHSFPNKNAVLVKVVDSKLGDVYVYRQNNYYLTILPLRYGFLWRASFNISTESEDDKGDKVRTIGTISYTNKNGSMTVMVIDVKEKNVAYIEAGPKSNRVREKVKNNEYVVFTWDKAMLYYDVNPIAISGNGVNLYKYGDLIVGNTDTKQLRWREVHN
jgi:hypothetical protein